MNFEKIKETLHNQPINEPLPDGDYLVHKARGVKALLYLQEAGADFHVVNRLGQGPIVSAVERKNIKAVRFLIEHTRADMFDEALYQAIHVNPAGIDIIRVIVEAMIEIPNKVLEKVAQAFADARYTLVPFSNHWRSERIKELMEICKVLVTRKYSYFHEEANYSVVLFDVRAIKETFDDWPSVHKYRAAAWGCQYAHMELARFIYGTKNFPVMVHAIVRTPCNPETENFFDYVFEKADTHVKIQATVGALQSDNPDMIEAITSTEFVQKTKDSMTLLPACRAYGAVKCFKKLLELGFAPYHNYPTIYRASDAPFDIIRIYDQDDEFSQETIDFFTGTGPGTAKYLNTLYSLTPKA